MSPAIIRAAALVSGNRHFHRHHNSIVRLWKGFLHGSILQSHARKSRKDSSNPVSDSIIYQALELSGCPYKHCKSRIDHIRE